MKQIEVMVTTVMGEVLDVGVWSGGALCKGDKYTALGELRFSSDNKIQHPDKKVGTAKCSGERLSGRSWF